MKTRRTVALGLSAVMAVSVLSGCGNSSSSTTADTKGESNASAESSTEPVVLHWWGSFAENMGPEQVCEAFNKIDPNLQVEYTRYVNDDAGNTKLDMTLMSDDSIDVFLNMNDVLLMKRIENGYMYPLDELFEGAGFSLEDDYDENIAQKEINGHYYSLPAKRITSTILYNQKMFDDAGLSYPDETWTWDDLYDAAKKLTNGDQYGFCMNTSNDQDTYYNMVYSMGGYIVNDDHTKSGYDDANTIKAMDYVGKLLKDCCPPATTMSETGTDVMFQSGTVAMITQGSWMTAGFLDNEYLVENCDVAILPYDKTTGMRTSICNGLGWAASADTKRPDDCWKLIEWLGSKEMQEKQAELGVTMSAYNNTSDKWVNCTDKFNLNAYLDITKDSTVSGVTNELVLRPYTYNSTVWSQAAQTFFADAWADPSKMEQSCKDFAVQMNQYIDEEDK